MTPEGALYTECESQQTASRVIMQLKQHVDLEGWRIATSSFEDGEEQGEDIGPCGTHVQRFKFLARDKCEQTAQLFQRASGNFLPC